MIRGPPGSTRTDALCPDTTLVRSGGVVGRRRRGCGMVHAEIVAPDIKKARSGETVPGFWSLPHVGCGLIVKESLVPLHAAVQNRTSRFGNPLIDRKSTRLHCSH